MASMSNAERRVTRLLDRVPGYRGYRIKEDRRDADRRVREHVASAFAAQADRIEQVARDLATQRRIQDVGPVDEFARTVRHLIDRILTATYGYGGLFSDRQVDERALDQLRQFDEGLLTGVEELEPHVAALEQAHAAGNETAPPARAGTTMARTLLARLDLRAQVIETGKPAPEDKILELLASPQPEGAIPPPAFHLRDGDAIAILGDNYLVDARIDLQVAGRALRLFRIAATPERWLAVPADRGQTFALLESVADAELTAPASTIGGKPYTVNWSGAGTGELIGKGGASGQRSVTVTVLHGQDDAADRAVALDWGRERMVLAGREVHPDDVEIFGAATPRR